MIYTEQHRELMRSVTKFVETEINPHAEEWEKAGIFPAHDVFKKMGEQGFLGINKPENFGGLGLDYSYEIAFCEALGANKCSGVAMGIGVHTDMATPALTRYGSDELREEFLRPSIAGDYVSCLGVSEAGAGSDVASIKTTARKDGSDYVINGGKMWTTNGTQADWMCLLANTSEGPVHRNKSLICLPMKTKGVEIARKLDKLGMRASDTAQIYFDDVRVPQRYRIGEEGMGFIYQMQQFQEERIWAAAGHLIGMERAIQMTIDYTAGRMAFGKPIIDNQVVHFKFAELQTKIELSALARLSRRQRLHERSGYDAARLDGEAHRRSVDPRSQRCLPAILGRHGFHERERNLSDVSRRAPKLDRRRRRRGHADNHRQGHGHPAGAAEQSLARSP